MTGTPKLTITWIVEDEKTGEEYPGPPLSTTIDVATLVDAFEGAGDDEITDPDIEEFLLTAIREDFVEKMTPAVDDSHLATVIEEARKLILVARKGG